MIEIVRIFKTPILFPAIVFGSIILEFLVRSFSNKINQIVLLASFLIAAQAGLFFQFKKPNIYEELGISRLDEQKALFQQMQSKDKLAFSIQEQIIANRERLLFYEKYHSITDDLNTIRSQSYQNDHIIQSLNSYLLYLMIGIGITQQKKFHSSRNIIISILLILFAYEASLVLETDLDTLKNQSLFKQYTVKENLLLIKSILLTVLVALKYILSEVDDHLQEAIQSTQNQLDFVQKKMEDNVELQNEINKTANLLKDVEKLEIQIAQTKRWLSTENVHRVMFIATIYLLFTGDYEQ